MAELFNKPRITATDPEGKISQLTNFIYQLVEQLNWAFNALPGANGEEQQADNGGR